jgi:uncharacterized protein
MSRRFSHVVGVDDAPFPKGHRGDVRVVATVFCETRLEGLLSGKIRRDGANSTRALAELIGGSRFAAHLQAVLLQGIALGGFNVVDIHALSERLGMAVLVVARRLPDMAGVKRALIERVPGGARKWALIERAGPMEPSAGVFIQRAGISLAEVLIERLAIHSRVPEPLRAAHIIAGGMTTGQSPRGRV